MGLTRWIQNLFSAIWAWCSIWWIDLDKLKRRKRFVDSMVSDKDKKSAPGRLWYAAYRMRGIK